MAVLVERPLEVTSNSDGLVDLIGIGIEPTTSSMPFLISDWSGATQTNREGF